VNSDQYERVEELFDRLVQVPTARRGEELERQCPDDPDVREEVTRLLACADPTVSTGADPALLKRLREGAFLAANAAAAAGGSLIGSSIGPYTVLEKIGEGGFGSVYTAEQRQPIRRIVALKVIKLGVDTKEVVARFNSERQALARMDHPNIAKVLDADSTVTGRPYFVMEYVAGSGQLDHALL
jgi:eukaryotic-like serine/threonine-protein kinase